MNFFRKAVSVSSITLLSRILGMLRDALIAFVFGASIASDAFFIAFRPFDVARKMMSDGILTLSFVPVFSGILSKQGRSQAVSMFLSACFIVSMLSVVAAVLGIYLAPMVIKVLAPGYLQGSYAQSLSVLLLKIMMPYMGIIFMVALSMGVLNCLGNFWVPAATPIILNLCVIAATVFLSDYFSPPVSVLAAGVTLGGVIQLGAQIPWLRRAGMLNLQRFRIYHWGVKRMMKTLLPSVVGASAFQVNMLVAGLLASTLAPGGVSSLYYAERLVQFPLALFAASVATVLLPMLSGRAAVQGMTGIGPGFGVGVKLVFFLIIPAMAGMMVLNRPIVSLLFARGAFDAAAVAQTGDCLFWLSAGLWAMAGTRLFVTFHFALSNIRLPFLAGLFSIVCNLILGTVLGRCMGVTGLSVAVAVSTIAGFVFLALRSPVEAGLKPVAVSACRAVFISGIMIGPVHWIWRVWSDWMMPVTIWAQGVGLCVAISAGVALFFTVAVMVAKEDVQLFKQVIFTTRYDH
ncbi:MAG: murein biosynthesis integral membrane protein MurJ [Desulfobacterales bacterium]|nr:MAG: murein biosynthesis integral membrane protein MurJ [Desulfobacterales bacterium]